MTIISTNVSEFSCSAFLSDTPDGKRIVGRNFDFSEKYIKNMTEPHLKLGERFGFMNYGYLWYKPFDDREVYAAIGDSGNIIYANKEVKVSVSTGTATFIDEMDVETQYLNANLNYLNAQKSLILAYYKLISLTGVGYLQ